MRRHGRLPVLAGTVAGIAAAGLITLLQESTYRADASIALVRQGQPPGDDPALAQAAAATADLFHSRAVAEPAIANLRLDESADELLERVSVETEAESSLVRVSVEAPSRDEARRTAQELTELATVRFNDRFGPKTVASVWEAARAEEDRVSPKPARNLALGALAGALLVQLLLSWRRRPRPVVSAPPVPRRDPKLEPEPELEPTPEPKPASEPEPEPAPVSTGPFVRPRLGEWTIVDVERLLAQEGPRFPDRLDELGWYLETFRDIAEDGRLPGSVDIIVEEVFGELIGSAESAEGADRNGG
jgi:capsular polysaccharide biosynthesis protein